MNELKFYTDGSRSRLSSLVTSAGFNKNRLAHADTFLIKTSALVLTEECRRVALASSVTSRHTWARAAEAV